MSAVYKSLLLAGLLSIAPTLTFPAAPNPEPTEQDVIEQEDSALPILMIDPNQAKELAVPYLATLLPLSKETLTYAHAHADEICKELLFNLEHRLQTLPAQKQAAQQLLLDFESFCKHMIMLPAPDLQTALKNPKTKALIQGLAHRWNGIETLSLSLYPATECPIMNQAVQKGLVALHTLANDIWSIAKTQGASFFTKPMKQLTLQEKAQLVTATHGICLALNQLISHGLEANLKLADQNKALIEALRTVLKDEVLYKELLSKIDASKRTVEGEKLFDALITMGLNAEGINSASLNQLQQAYAAQNQAALQLLQAEQQKLALAIIKFQQVIFDIFMAKRSAH